MLVYGDPSRELELHAVIDSLRHRLRQGESSLDDLRELLIEAGQLEQAIADAGPNAFGDPASANSIAMALTDAVARAFVSKWHGDSEGVSPAAFALDQLGKLPNVRLRAKLPEGFAFYALYPEQYCVAAAQWMREHSTRPARDVIVVGVRSIGTSLSAVVMAELRRSGWNARRITVRPAGHPFDRHATIDAGDVVQVRHAIVVDEGPGMSGSSMVACAKALIAAGMPRETISFFPGHGKMPGNAASDEIRQWWEKTPRYAVPIGDLRWHGQSLTELLAQATERVTGQASRRIEDLSTGKWREIAYADESHWPAVGATFERTKFRVVLRDGSSVLWKFSGLCGGGEASRERGLAEMGFTVPPLARSVGFVGSPWIEGERLATGDPDLPLLDRVAAYIRAAGRPPLDASERRTAFDRLREMTCVNVREGMGDSASDRAAVIADAAAPLAQIPDLPAYGDGRPAPHEWVRTPEGRILKTDCVGHESDHTLIGRQPIPWDVAGAIVEWNLSPSGRDVLLRAFETLVPEPALRFYELAYAAFRLGFCTLCARMTEAGSDEPVRLNRAAERYRSTLRALLQ